MADENQEIVYDANYVKISGSPCGDPTCYRGGVGGWNYQFKDGPCDLTDCKWPKDLRPRPHFTDTPATPIVDAGKVALEELKKRKKT